MSEEKENLTGHEYDGIKEYDNPLPRWWLITFLGTILFAVIYWAYYQFGGAPNQTAELKKDLAEIRAQDKSDHQHDHGSPGDEDELKKLMANATVVAKGKEVFGSRCVPCHGVELQGVIGPNLVDDYWIHGKGHLSEIIAIVRKGVLEKGMPAWETMLKDDEIKAVVVYVGSMRGTKPANPKAPQGEKVVHD